MASLTNITKDIPADIPVFYMENLPAFIAHPAAPLMPIIRPTPSIHRSESAMALP
jgi:hypothetical protein